VLKGREIRTHATATLDQEALFDGRVPPLRYRRELNTHLPVLGKIGFVGLGRMGTAMAANLAAVGWQVIAYVRHPDRTHS